MVVIKTYHPSNALEFGKSTRTPSGWRLTGNKVLIPISYFIILGTIAMMQFQLVWAIAHHARKAGWRSLVKGDVWEAKAGEWEGGIVLGKDEEKVAT